MDRLRNIVIGVDFSDSSKIALAQAKRMARWNQADLHVIHVVEEQAVTDQQKAMGHTWEQAAQHLRQTVQSRMAALFAQSPLEQRQEKPSLENEKFPQRRPSPLQRIELHMTVGVGSPFKEVMDCVRQAKADLLILGPNGTSDPWRRLGQLATQCVRNADCQVLIVRQLHAEPFTQIAACMDFSHASGLVAQQAIRMARQDQAKLHLLHVYCPPWDVLPYKSPTLSSSPDFKKQYQQNLFDKLAVFLSDRQNELQNLQTEFHLVENPRAVEGLLEYVGRSGVDLVVLACPAQSAGKTPTPTQAEQIVQHIPISVLVIKPPIENP